MSNDTPSPLRDLALRLYIASRLRILFKFFNTDHTVENLRFGDESIQEKERNQSLKDLVGQIEEVYKVLIDRNGTVHDAIKKILSCESETDIPLTPVLIEAFFADSLRGNQSNAIDIESVRSQYLGKINHANWKELSRKTNELSANLIDVQFDPMVMCAEWIRTSQAIGHWQSIAERIWEYVYTSSCNNQVIQLARLFNQSSLNEQQVVIDGVISKFHRVIKNDLLGNVSDEEVNSAVAELRKLKLDLGDINGSLTNLIKAQVDGDSFRLDEIKQNNISRQIKSIENTLSAASEYWPPSLLLDTTNCGVSLDELGKEVVTPADSFGVESGEYQTFEENCQLSAVCAITQSIAQLMYKKGKNEVVRKRSGFNELLSKLFKPFGGEVKVYWDCPSESEFDDVDYKRHVLTTECDPFGQGKCLKPTIAFISDQGRHRFIQDGEYVRPQSIPPIGQGLKDFADALADIDEHDPYHVNELRRFYQSMYNFVQFADWWNVEGKKFEVKEQVWTVMSVVTSIALGGSRTDNIQSPANSLYGLFVGEGFHWKTLGPDEVKENQPPESPEWAIVPLPMKDGLDPKAPLVACHQPVGLMGPGGKFILPPNKWLVVAPDLLKGDSLLACLYNCKSHINSLRKSAPEWDGLKLFDDAYASFDGGEPSKKDRDRIAFDIFRAAYVEKDNVKENKGIFFKKITHKFYEYLGKEDAGIWPRLDAQLSPIKPSEDFGEYDPKPEIVWEGGDQPHGSVLSVEQFAFDGQRAIIHLSLGPGFDPQAKAWMDLFDRIANANAQSDLLKPLADFQDDVNALPLSDSPDHALAALESKLIQWLSSGDGNRALNAALLHLQNDPASKVGRVWMDCIKLLRNKEEFEIYPRISLVEGNLEVDWPIESAGLHGVDWQFDATTGVGQLIGDRVTFSPDKNDATGVFSLGPESPASPITVAHQLTQLGEALGDERIANAARVLLGLSMVSDVPLLEIESSLRALVQLIADESIWPEATISQRDQILAATRRWAEFHRYTIIPEMFTYAESAVPAGNKEELVSIFCDVSEVGRAIVSQFGILDPQGSALQKEKCVISAGPPPAGYEQLKAALMTEDGLQQLCGLMEQWPAQRVKSERALHNAIKGEFFDALFKAIDNLDDAAKAAQIQEIFAETLKSELSAFLFSPTRIGDVDDGWWKPINRSETMSGKIKKVIKPGLRDNKGLLIAPAVVELD